MVDKTLTRNGKCYYCNDRIYTTNIDEKCIDCIRKKIYKVVKVLSLLMFTIRINWNEHIKLIDKNSDYYYLGCYNIEKILRSKRKIVVFSLGYRYININNAWIWHSRLEYMFNKYNNKFNKNNNIYKRYKYDQILDKITYEIEELLDCLFIDYNQSFGIEG